MCRIDRNMVPTKVQEVFVGYYFASHVIRRKLASYKNAGKFSYKMFPKYKCELYHLHCEHVQENFLHMSTS